MNELFLYDRDEGLFRKILDKSSIIEGRYHVSPNYGHDLNTNNLDSFIQDPKYGLTTAGQKYPITVCLTPRSRFVKLPSSQRTEELTFTLFFLCKSFVNAVGDVNQPDPGTNLSTHHVWYDWQDMKECADNFLEALRIQFAQKTVEPSPGADPVPLKLYCQMDRDTAIFSRYSKFQTDQLNGVSVTFIVYMNSMKCTMKDYEGINMVTDITIPDAVIHELHK